MYFLSQLFRLYKLSDCELLSSLALSLLSFMKLDSYLYSRKF